MPESLVKQQEKLISIERVVAFVLGPILVAASGSLSAWLSTKFGLKVTPATISASFVTGGVTAGALVWKWLHGRQQWLVQKFSGMFIRDFNAIASQPGGKELISIGAVELENLARRCAELALSGSPPGAQARAAARSADGGAATAS